MKSLENQLDFMDEFLDIYLNRPFKKNTGGMKFNHSFSLYTTLKIKNPKLVIESGIWKGHSTYLIEAAVPDAEIVSLDLNLDFREYISNRVRYIEKDFNDIDWSATENKNNSLIFFDDHQNCLERLKEMKWWGFNLAIFEDNYPPGEGDAYSLKQVKEKSGHKNIQLSTKYKPKIKATDKRILKKRFYINIIIVKIWSSPIVLICKV